MEKRYVPMDQLATQEQVDQLVDNGWVYWGQVPMVVGHPVLTLSAPEPLAPKMCIVLIRPEPMVPMGKLAGVVAGARGIDELCRTLFGVGQGELKRRLASPAPEGS